ncbi:MAG: hypothetical protein CR997_09600 [Acidobacteria bacterium]|nr:MAG: hypothetical protein CR997_09600 [Acidobacteriota bacterium]
MSKSTVETDAILATIGWLKKDSIRTGPVFSSAALHLGRWALFKTRRWGRRNVLEVESTPYPRLGGKDQQESAVVVFKRVNMQSVGSYHCLDYITVGCKLLRSYGFGDKQGAIESENLWLSNLFTF